ncbi:NB-ARC domain-containing protein [Methanothrix sp.]|uniref:NB-ARC domain-containing protein n=1 Tax=Methanothrix sp. TaxID=90426 RepID=UPI003C73B79E
MNDNEILEAVVVEVSRDKKEGSGTGFYISADEIATCYHVLVPEGKKPKRNGIYWIRNDSRDKKAWQKATLVKSRPLPDDIAILKTEKRLDLFWPELLRPWDKKTCSFLSRGYTEVVGDDNIADFYATQIDGEIKADIWIYEEKSRRLQLDTPREAIKPGRSGSPVLSLSQKAIVGMIDYQGGELHQGAQIGTAIPIEDIVPPIGSPGRCRLIAGIPELPANFLPRPSDLRGLRDALISGDHSTTAITSPRNEQQTPSRKLGVHGMGGIGKSVLAAAAARDEEVQRYFSDGIFWVTLGTEPKITQKQAELARMIDCQPYAFESTAEGRIALGRLLAGKACLVILDDVWSSSDVKELIGDLGPKGRMLITTRDGRIITALAAIEYPLGLLKEEDSRELLASWAGLDQAQLPSQAAEVIDQCGRLPLALALCGAQIRDGVSWSDLLEALKEADLKFLDHEERSVMKSLKVSVDRLSEEERECYLLLAVFPPDETIPEAAILTLWAHARKLDEKNGRRLLAVLDRRSLLKRDIDDISSAIEIHDLLHDFLRASCSDLQALHDLILDAYRPAGGGWPSGPNDGYFFQHLVYHLTQAQRSEEISPLLLDFDWIEAKLQATDVPSLLSDYDRADSDEDLSLIQGAIRLSAHVLSRNPEQLPGQLTGRLLGIQIRSLESLIMQIPNRITYPWLRPLAGSLASPGGPLIRTLQGHTGGVWAVGISQNSKKAISVSEDHTLRIWDLQKGQETKIQRVPAGVVGAVAISQDGRRAVLGYGDDNLKIWDLEKGQEIKTLRGHTNWIEAVAISQDGGKAISGSRDNTLKIWDMEKGQEIKTLTGHTGAVLTVAISQDGGKVISGSRDNTLKIWDMERGQEIETLTGHTGVVRAVAISQDGRCAISGSDDNTLKVWDMEKGQEIKTLNGHTGAVWIMAISQDGRRAISESSDNILKLWDLDRGQERKTWAGHMRRAGTIVISKDGRRVISKSSDNSLELWNPENGEIKILRGHTGGVVDVAISYDGRRAISVSCDHTLKMWDLENGQEIKTLTGHTGGVCAVAITLDGRCAISGSDDNTLKVWDLKTGKEIKTLTGHTDGVITVALSSDGRQTISGSFDNTLKLWNLETGQILVEFSGEAPITAIALSKDGQRMVAGDASGRVHLLALENSPK